MARFPVNGQSYSAWSVNVNSQRTVNWYPEIDPTGKNNVILYPTPGSELFTTCGAGVVRAMLSFSDGNLYVVSGSEFYQVDSNGNTTLKGNLSTSSGRVEMADNGTQILIVDGSKGYMYVPSTDTYTADVSVVDADFPNGADSVEFLDGYFIVNDPNNTNALGVAGAFFISALYDGLTWTSLDYDVASRSPDQINTIRRNNGQMWLIGETTSEVWFNSGNATFPFEPITSAVINFGTPAGASVAKANNSLIFLSKNSYGQGEIVMTNGYGVVKISNQALDTAIQGYSTITDAFAFVMQFHGHAMYAITFPTANKTWVYDLSNGMWFEWATNGSENRHISNCYSYYGVSHVVGAYDSGKLYKLMDTIYDDDSTAITRLRRTPHIHMQDRAIFGSVVSLKFEQGVANASFPNPQAMLRWSDDGGHTWSSEYWRSILGATGVYDFPSTWRRIGMWYDRVFEIKITDGVKAVLIDGYLDMDFGDDEVAK